MKKICVIIAVFGVLQILRAQTLTGKILEVSSAGDTSAVPGALIRWLNSTKEIGRAHV